MAGKIDAAYGPCCVEHRVMNIPESQGTLHEIASFASVAAHA